jgi:hypothetical protein
MAADKPGRPDVAKIADQSRAMVASGQISRAIAMKGLRQIEENMRRDFGLTADDLQPITQLIKDLQADDQ